MAISVPSRGDVLREHTSTGGRVAAVLPIHAPRALLRAHGFLPVEVWGPKGGDGPEADAHLQAYTCSVIRSSLGFLLSKQAEFADVFVIPHCCDSAQGLASVLLDLLKPARPVLPFYLPRGEGEAAVEFTVAELRRLGERLREAGGRPLDAAALAAAVQLEEETDRLLAALFTARPTLSLSNAEFYGLVRAREYLPPEVFQRAAAEALKQTAPANGQARLLVSGVLPEPAAVLDELDRLGARIVADDFACTGRRLYPPGQSADPWRRLAEGLLAAAPDSTRGASIERRAAHLVNLARTTGAQAAVFFEVKFCEPEQFYLPELRSALEKEGIRSVAIELHPTEPLPHQAITRLEALLETQA